MSAAGFRFEDVTVAVDCEHEDDLVWLASFLDCGFEQVSAANADRHVEFVIDERRYDRLRESSRPGSMYRVAGFAGDSGSRPLECWSPGVLFHDPARSVFIRLDDDGARVQIVARHRDRKVRTCLMRVVRELTMGLVIARGGTLLHAAAVGTEHGVVLLCGPKRAGKTTLLMSLLRDCQVRYVSADRCVVRNHGDGISARGLPTLVSIRTDAFALFPEVHRRLASVRPDRADLASARPKVSVTPPEFCEMLACERIPEGPLVAIVFPCVSTDPARLTLRRLSEIETIGRLRRGLFRADADRVLGDVFIAGLGVIRNRSARELAAEIEPRIAATIPCFECKLGGAEAPRYEESRELLASLGDSLGASGAPEGVAWTTT